MRRGALAVVVGLSLVGCVSHPVGPARTYAAYEGKAATTAEAALSAVETARLVATTRARDHAFGPFVVVTLSEQEDAASSVQGTFASIEPPNSRADGLRDELNELLGDAVDDLATLRIAARRGEQGLDTAARPLARDARRLRAFSEDHGG